MDYPKEGSKSLYDYSDQSIPQAGYAAIVYALISTLSTGLAWFRAPTTPWIAVAIVAIAYALDRCGGSPTKERATTYILTNHLLIPRSSDEEIVATG